MAEFRPTTALSGQDRRCLTIGELAAVTTLSVSALARLKKKGILAAIQPGGPRHRMFFTPDSVERALRAATAVRPDLSSDPPPAGARPDRPVTTPGPRTKWRKKLQG